jgi:hypothetical protein
MTLLLDISGKGFDDIGFGESHIFLNIPPSNAIENYTLFVWGIDFDNVKLKHNNVPPVDIYVSGLSKLTFCKPESIKITIYPYKDESGNGFLFDEAKKKVKFQEAWTFGCMGGQQSKYYIVGVLDFPFGYVEIEISSLDKVMLEMDSKHFITVKEYSMNPHSYTYVRS